MQRTRFATMALCLLAPLVLLGLSGPPYHPDINPDHFARRVTNPYFPLRPGTIFHFRTADGAQTDDVEVTHDTRVILGVTTTVVRDRVYLADGSLLEEAFDWYAQDDMGNVWYFGEATAEYDHGVLISTEGSWESGVNGAQPGIIMQARPRTGDRYRQEFAAGVAEDWARVVSLDASAAVPYGMFRRCIQTRDWSALEHPIQPEYKFYAPGVGLILEVDPRTGERNHLVSITRP